jgi:hypothetical protein
MTGIELFLTKKIFGSEQHPLHWDRYAYDDENVHYTILQILCESSPVFAQALLALSVAPKHVSVSFKPEKGLFDLCFEADDAKHYCEVKIWARLSPAQFQKQTAFLTERGAKGIYVLFTYAADNWPQEEVFKQSAGLSRVVNGVDLLGMLASVEKDLPDDVLEIASAYRKALESLNLRQF